MQAGSGRGQREAQPAAAKWLTSPSALAVPTSVTCYGAHPSSDQHRETQSKQAAQREGQISHLENETLADSLGEHAANVRVVARRVQWRARKRLCGTACHETQTTQQTLLSEARSLIAAHCEQQEGAYSVRIARWGSHQTRRRGTQPTRLQTEGSRVKHACQQYATSSLTAVCVDKVQIAGIARRVGACTQHNVSNEADISGQTSE